MKTACFHGYSPVRSHALSPVAAAWAFFVLFALALTANSAQAARIGVLSNNYAATTAADFATKIPAHTFSSIDTSSSVPTLAALTAAYDVLLVFEDGRFANSKAVGDVAAKFANTGRPVVIGTFYDQDRSDVVNTALTIVPVAGGWGALEAIDPSTSDGIGVRTDAFGVPNITRVLNIASIVPHPLTKGVTALGATTGFAGGNQAKAGTIVLANWTEVNARGQPDPAIAYRVTGLACVVQIGIAPDYAVGVGTGYGSGNFTGDFYVVWKNAFDFAAASCGTSNAVPALSSGGIALTGLLVIAIAFSRRRRLFSRVIPVRNR